MRLVASWSRRLWLLSLLVCVPSAHAYIDWMNAEWTAMAPTEQWFASADAACAAVAAAKTPPSTVTGKDVWTATFPRAYLCKFANGSQALTQESCGHLPGGGWSNDSENFRCIKTVSQCPTGETPDANGVCQPPPPCVSGGTAASGYFDQGTDPNKMSAVACVNGCQAVFDGYTRMGSAVIDGVKHYFALGEFVKTGAECTGSSGLPNISGGLPQPPASTCGQGQVLGTVNGQPVCADGGTGTPYVPPVTSTTEDGAPVTNPDGSTTDTDTTTTTNPDGSVTETTTTTTCDAQGNCTTTTVTTPPYNVPGADGEQTPEPDEEACALDPSNPACQEEQTEEEKYCEQNPDAVQCAELGDPGDDAPTWTTRTVTYGAESLGFGGGSCPTPGTMTVHGIALTWRYDQLCNVAPFIRVALLLLASIAATSIIVRETS
jgi:hypothetical protein